MNRDLLLRGVELALTTMSNRELTETLYLLATELRCRQEHDAANYVTKAFAAIGENVRDGRGRTPRASSSASL